jgi:hypothetical protein
MMSTGAAMHRGSSMQTYRTPDDFRLAVVKRFGMPHWDLAAEPSTVFADDKGNFYSESDDSLARVWSLTEHLCWLNPPFSNIQPWAKKCAEESEKGAHILLLTPASIGSNWFAQWVWPFARVYALNPRLSFDGSNPYPKDCILAEYGRGRSTFQCWVWK